MPRYNLYQGVKGKLVGHPRASLGQRLFVCQRRLPSCADCFDALCSESEAKSGVCSCCVARRLTDAPPKECTCEFVDRFVPTAEVHAEHAMLAKAVKAGDLLKLNKKPCVAKTQAEASAVLLPKSSGPAPALAKTGGKKGSS